MSGTFAMVEHDVFGMSQEQSDDWYSSLLAVEQAVSDIVNLDPAQQILIWRDGSELSFDESVEHIHARHPEHPQDFIHSHLQGWLEQGELPEGLSEEEVERLDTLVSDWAEQIPDRIKTPVD